MIPFVRKIPVLNWKQLHVLGGRLARKLFSVVSVPLWSNKTQKDSTTETLRTPRSILVPFYPLAAGEGLLPVRANPNWRNRYFAEKFDGARYLRH